MLTMGEITPKIMCTRETACLGYFESKEVVEQNQICKVLAGIKNDHIQELLLVNRKDFHIF